MPAFFVIRIWFCDLVLLVTTPYVFGRLSKAAAKCDSLPREGGREGFDPLSSVKPLPAIAHFSRTPPQGGS